MDPSLLNQLLPHLGYLLMLIALVVREILWLRTILIGAQVCLLSYALMERNYPVAFWNFVFVGINVYQVIRILRERKPVDIDPELVDLYRGAFSRMTPREFRHFWKSGQIKDHREGVLVREGEMQGELLLLLSGHVEVEKNGKPVTRLHRGNFMSEMSFITGEPATASVSCTERIRYIAWGQQKLDSLERVNPQMLIKIQGILGKELIGKIKSATQIRSLGDS